MKDFAYNENSKLEHSLFLDGILLLNKPQFFTSQQVVSKVKHLFQTKKAGHTGSLDPIATGLLPICLGESTKFSQFLLKTDKHYRVKAKLGIRTNTGDSEGQIVSQHSLITPFSQSTLTELLSQFMGEISQTPPMFSALKHKGKPLYHWARQGITIQRPARPIHIYQLDLIHYELDQLILEVKCSKGTYIRSLIDDMGQILGCGAHICELHRLSVGPYTIKQSIELDHLESLSTLEARTHYLLPIDTALPPWPAVKLSEPAAFYLRRGQPLALPNIPTEGCVRLYLKTNQQFIGIGQILTDGRLAPSRIINQAI